MSSTNNNDMEDADDAALVSALNDYEHQEEARMSDDEDEMLIAALNNVEQQQQQQQQQQQEEERTPARPADGELRRFLVGGGLLDEGETLSQGLDRLDQLYAEVLQDYTNQVPQPSAASTAMHGKHFIF